MKRILLIIFILFVIPVIVVSCKAFEDDCKSSSLTWTFASVEMNAISTINGSSLSEGDTIKSDSIFINCWLKSKRLTQFHYSNSNYSAMACAPSFISQVNVFSKIIFGTNEDGTSSIDTSITNSLELTNSSKLRYPLKLNYQNFLTDIANPYNGSSFEHINGKFLNPHNSKSIQIVMIAIRENGDTLKAISQKVFCK